MLESLFGLLVLGIVVIGVVRALLHVTDKK